MVLLYQRQFTEHDEKINYAKNHYFDQTISFSPFIFSFEWKNMKDIYNFCKYTPVHDSIRLWRFLVIHILYTNIKARRMGILQILVFSSNVKYFMLPINDNIDLQ